MSKKQPFCDSSHSGTKFKPLKFSLDKPADKMYMCGCKLSATAPFCDGVTCKNMLSGEDLTSLDYQLQPESKTEAEKAIE